MTALNIPEGLIPLLETITRSILLKEPQDIFEFLSEYATDLAAYRDLQDEKDPSMVIYGYEKLFSSKHVEKHIKEDEPAEEISIAKPISILVEQQKASKPLSAPPKQDDVARGEPKIAPSKVVAPSQREPIQKVTPKHAPLRAIQPTTDSRPVAQQPKLDDRQKGPVKPDLASSIPSQSTQKKDIPRIQKGPERPPVAPTKEVIKPSEVSVTKVPIDGTAAPSKVRKQSPISTQKEVTKPVPKPVPKAVPKPLPKPVTTSSAPLAIQPKPDERQVDLVKPILAPSIVRSDKKPVQSTPKKTEFRKIQKEPERPQVRASTTPKPSQDKAAAKALVSGRSTPKTPVKIVLTSQKVPKKPKAPSPAVPKKIEAKPKGQSKAPKQPSQKAVPSSKPGPKQRKRASRSKGPIPSSVGPSTFRDEELALLEEAPPKEEVVARPTIKDSVAPILELELELMQSGETIPKRPMPSSLDLPIDQVQRPSRETIDYEKGPGEEEIEEILEDVFATAKPVQKAAAGTMVTPKMLASSMGDKPQRIQNLATVAVKKKIRAKVKSTPSPKETRVRWSEWATAREFVRTRDDMSVGMPRSLLQPMVTSNIGQPQVFASSYTCPHLAKTVHIIRYTRIHNQIPRRFTIG